MLEELIYLSHFSWEWTEIWHDDSVDGRDLIRLIADLISLISQTT